MADTHSCASDVPVPFPLSAPAGVSTNEMSVVRPASQEDGISASRVDSTVVPVPLSAIRDDLEVVPFTTHGDTADALRYVSDVSRPVISICRAMRTSSFLLDVCVADENTDASGVLEEVPGPLFDLLHATEGYPMMVHRVHTSPAAAPTLEGNTTNVQFVVCLSNVNDGVLRPNSSRAIVPAAPTSRDGASGEHLRSAGPSPHAVDMPGSSFDAFTAVCSRNAHDECTPVPAIPRGNMSGAHHCTSDVPYLCDPSHNRYVEPVARRTHCRRAH